MFLLKIKIKIKTKTKTTLKNKIQKNKQKEREGKVGPYLARLAPARPWGPADALPRPGLRTPAWLAEPELQELQEGTVSSGSVRSFQKN
jgi:hypothetical protein